MSDRPRCPAYKMDCASCGYHATQEEKMLPTCPQCGTPREQCTMTVAPGYETCFFHADQSIRAGWKKPAVVDLAKQGERSKFPLRRLAERYREMESDGRILSLRTSMDVLHERQADLMERIDLNWEPERVEKLMKLWDKYKAKRTFGPDEVQVRAEIDLEFEKAYHDYAAWKQMLETMDIEQKLAVAEVKIVKDIKAVITIEDAYKMTAKLLAAVVETVQTMTEMPDSLKVTLIKRVQNELTKIIGEKPDRGSGRGGEEDSDTEGGELD